MPGIKEVKHSTKTASSDNKSEDLHDDPIYIVRTPNKIYDSLKERMEIPPLNQVISIIKTPNSTRWNRIYHTTRMRLAQGYMKSLTLISEQF